MRLAVLVLLCCPVLVAAQPEKLAVDRPDQSESATTIPAGSFQVESGFAVLPAGNGPAGLDLPAVTLRLGLGDHVEFRAEGGASRTYDQERGEDWAMNTPELALKVGMGEGGGTGITTAVLAKAGIPAWADAGTTGLWPSLLLAADRDFGERFGLGTNVGMAWEEAASTAFCSLSGGLDVSSKLGVFAELYSAFPEDGEGDHRWDCGAFWAVGDRMLMDASFGSGFQGQGWFVGAGFSFRVGLWNTSPPTSGP